MLPSNKHKKPLTLLHLSSLLPDPSSHVLFTAPTISRSIRFARLGRYAAPVHTHTLLHTQQLMQKRKTLHSLPTPSLACARPHHHLSDADDHCTFNLPGLPTYLVEEQALYLLPPVVADGYGYDYDFDFDIDDLASLR